MGIEQIVEQYAPALEQELQMVLQDRIAESPPNIQPLYGMLQYHLGWADETLKPTRTNSGKRIRPVICLLSCEACGGNWERALSAAAAIELVHNFTLIHDDIQDRSVERRHRPSVWTLWGEAQGINTGDALYSISSLALFRSIQRGVRPNIVLSAAQTLSTTLLSVCEGQYLDIAFERRNDVTSEMYLAMIARKTAALIGCSAQIGAYLATDDAILASYLREFGQAVGMAFQIQDDVLGIWGETPITGKPVGDDIYQHKKTLPVLHALEVAGPNDRRRLVEILTRRAVAREEVTDVVEVLSRLGAKEHAEQTAQKWLDQALFALEKANPQGPAGDGLRELAMSLIGRDS